MKNREPISSEAVLNSLSSVSEDEAWANARLILRPFENTILFPPTSRPVHPEELYLVERNEGYFTNESTLRGAEHRMHLLGAISTRTFVVPESLPTKPEQLRGVMFDNATKKLAMASVSITSSYPIWFKAEHSVTVSVSVNQDASAKEAAAIGVAAFLNNDGLMDEDAKTDFSNLLAETRQMIDEDGQRIWSALGTMRGRSQITGLKGLLKRLH